MILKLTLCTYLLLSLNTWITLAMGHQLQYQHNITSTKIYFPFCHFVCTWSDWRYSFLQRGQNSLATCWTWQDLFQQNKSGLLKFSGGGITAFDFMVRMFQEERSKSLVELLVISTTTGCEFRIPSVSTTIVSKDSSSSDSDGAAQVNLICLSQKPPVACSRSVSNSSH